MGTPVQVETAAQEAEDYIKSLAEVHAEEEIEDVVVDNNEQVEESTDDTEEAIVDTDEEETYEKRYRTLQGKYDAEVPRLQTQLKSLKEDIFDKIEETRNEGAPETVIAEEVKNVVSEKLQKFQDEYGEDFVDNLREFFQEEMKPLISEKVKPVEEQIESVSETQTKIKQDEFTSSLDESIKGDWREAWEGKDPKFAEFLEKTDPSGLYTYGELIENYNNNWDQERMAKVFNIYYGEKTSNHKPSNPSKDALVAPERKQNQTVPQAGEKKIWTEGAIEEFKRNDRQSKYSEDESQALWQDLLEAVGENRIRS